MRHVSVINRSSGGANVRQRCVPIAIVGRSGTFVDWFVNNSCGETRSVLRCICV
jgi:hypothetical protein